MEIRVDTTEYETFNVETIYESCREFQDICAHHNIPHIIDFEIVPRIDGLVNVNVKYLKRVDVTEYVLVPYTCNHTGNIITSQNYYVDALSVRFPVLYDITDVTIICPLSMISVIERHVNLTLYAGTNIPKIRELNRNTIIWFNTRQTPNNM